MWVDTIFHLSLIWLIVTEIYKVYFKIFNLESYWGGLFQIWRTENIFSLCSVVYENYKVLLEVSRLSWKIYPHCEDLCCRPIFFLSYIPSYFFNSMYDTPENISYVDNCMKITSFMWHFPPTILLIMFHSFSTDLWSSSFKRRAIYTCRGLLAIIKIYWATFCNISHHPS